jgi:hypothetical protein
MTEDRIGPRKGERFMDTIRRLAFELHGVPLDIEPVKHLRQSFEERQREIWRKTQPGDRQPGDDDGDEA